MKTFRYLIYTIVSLLAAGLVSCTEEEFYPGEPELENCYGVYFPEEQPNATAHMLNPADPRTLTFNISRLNEEDAITVPVVVEGSEEGIFEVAPVIFEDGQKDAVVTVSFDKAENSKNYSCRLSVEDPQYALVYGQNPLSVEFSFTIIEWELVTGPNGEKTGMWRDDLITGIFNSSAFVPGMMNAEHEVTIYERKDKENYYRIDNAYSETYVKSMVVEQLAAGVTCSNPSLIIDASDPDHVWMDLQSTGVDFGPSYYGLISVCSNVEEVISGADNLYGTLKNGVIEFPANGLLLSLAGYSAGLPYANASGKTRLILPGYEAPDYSLAVQAGSCTDGQLPVAFQKGTDVAAVKYAVYQGRLDDGQVFSYADNIINGTETNAKTLGKDETVVAVSGLATGFYTLVAVAFDAENNSQGYTSVSFGYVAKGDDKSVNIDAGLIVSDKYAPQGYTSENSMEFYIYGEDIENAYMSLFTTSSLAGASDDVIASALVSQAADTQLGSAEISEINNGGYVDIFVGLNPATSYTLVVYAENGYESTLVRAEAVTLGDPDPHVMIYSYNDFLPEQPELSGYFKTWNYYAVPSGSSSRVKVGSVTISDSDIADPDGGTVNVTVEGLLGPDVVEMGIQDKVTFFYYDGLIYTLEDYSFAPVDMEMTVYPGLKYGATDGNIYNLGGGSAMLGGLVNDGYVAFVGHPGYLSQGVEFNTIYLGAYADEERTQSLGRLVAFSDLLLVDPEVDTEPSTAAVSSSALNRIRNEWSEAPANYVETPDGRMKSIIDKHINGLKGKTAVAGLDITVDSRSVEFDTKPVDCQMNASGSLLNLKKVMTR